MDIPRGFETEQFKEIYLLGSRQKQIIAPHHFRHPHERVIRHHSQLIRPCTISSTQNKIAALKGEINGLVAIHSIIKVNYTVRYVQPRGTIFKTSRVNE